MKYGVIFPQTEYSHDPVRLREFAVTAESLGYESISIYEHVLGMNPERPGGWQGIYTSADAFLEPLVLFSHWAAVTRRIQLMTRVLVLPQRQTPLVAKQAATLDLLSAGRLILGVGVGWNDQEFIGMSSDFKTRGERVDEQIQLLRRLWTEPHVEFEGSWEVIPNAGINPLPRQRPIPIWLGGHAEATIRRVAELGDGWMPNYPTPEKAAPWFEKLDEALTDAGRERSEISIAVKMNYGEGEPGQWAQQVEAWRSAGVSHIDLDTMRLGFADDVTHLEALASFAEAFSQFETS